jgi:hypothetical protein
MTLREFISTVTVRVAVHMTGRKGESQRQCILGMDKKEVVNSGIQTAEWTCVSEVASRYLTH